MASYAPIVTLDYSSPFFVYTSILNFNFNDNPEILYVTYQLSETNTFDSPTTTTIVEYWLQNRFALTEPQRDIALYIRASVTDADGDSPWSDPITVTPYTRPTMPTLELKGSAPQRISVLMTNVEDVTEIQFEFSKTSTFDEILKHDVINGGLALSEYRVPEEDRNVTHYVRARKYQILDIDPDTGEELGWYSDWTDPPLAVDAAGKLVTADISAGSINAELISGSSLNQTVLSDLTVGSETGLNNLSTPEYVFVDYADVNTAITSGTQTLLNILENLDPPTTPFIIQIGTEECLVNTRTLVSGTTYNYSVTRAQNNTEASTHAASTSVSFKQTQGFVRLYSNGMTFRNSSGVIGLSLPSQGDAQFRGVVLANKFVSDYAKLRGEIRVDSDATATLSAGSLAAPAVAPNPEIAYPEVYRLFNDSLWNMNLTTTGGPGKNTKTVWCAVPYSANLAAEFDVSSLSGGAPFLSIDLPSATQIRSISVPGECHSAVKVKDWIYVLWYAGSITATSTMTISTFNATTLTLLRTQTVGVRGYEPGLFWDSVGNALCLIDVDSYTTGKNAAIEALRVRSWQVNDSDGTLTLRGDCSTANPDGTATGSAFTITGANSALNVSLAATVRPAPGSGTDNVGRIYVTVSDYKFEKIVRANVTRTTISGNSYITALSAPNTSTALDHLFGTPWNQAPWGLAWDSTLNSNQGGFWFIDGSGVLYATAYLPNTETYYWKHAFANVSGAIHEQTAVSDSYAAATRLPYTEFVLVPNTENPSAADAFNYYASSDKLGPYVYQGYVLAASTNGVLEVVEPNTSSFYTYSAFTGGTAGQITAESAGSGWSGAWALNGDGTADNLLAYRDSSYLTSDYTLTTSALSSSATDTGLALTSLEPGTWMIQAHITFENAASQNQRGEAVLIDTNGNWLASGETRVTANDWMTMSLSTIVTLSTATTIKLRAKKTAGTVYLKASTTTGSGKACSINAVRIA